MFEQTSSAALLAALPTPTLVIDPEGSVIAANPAACELLDYEDLTNLSVTTLLAQPERARLDPLAWLKKWADRPDAPELDYVFLTCTTRTGALRYLSVRVARINLDDAVNYLVSMHDMTSWQQRLRNEQDAHRVASRILSITADGVIIADESQAITYANESAEKMFGYDTGELLGSPLETLIPQRFHEAHAEDITRFLQSKQPSRLMAGRTPVTALTKAGQEIPVDVSITRINQHGTAVFSALVRLREA